MDKMFASAGERPAAPPRPTTARHAPDLPAPSHKRAITRGFEDRPAPRDPAPNAIKDPMLTKHLRLFGWVGSSGPATVWLAEHLALEIPVVVKVLPREIARDADALERFRRDAVLLARLRTAHVVQVLDHGLASNGSAYIVMELLEGETLESALRRRRAFTVDHRIEILLQTGRVLVKARDLGIRCKDIQPHKLFLVDGETGPFVKLTDFAIDGETSARRADEANVVALGDLAWRCLAATETMPDALEEWLAHIAAPPGEDSGFPSVREAVAELEAIARGAGRASPDASEAREASPAADEPVSTWTS
jgi:serine/threonine protein kinase